MSIDFQKPVQKKGANRYVRFSLEDDATLVHISEENDVDLAEVIRTFTLAGLEQWRKQGNK